MIDRISSKICTIPNTYVEIRPEIREQLKEAVRSFDLRRVMGYYGSSYTPVNFKPLNFEDSRKIAERIKEDSRDNIRVLFREGRTQVWQYNSHFMIRSHHKNPPYLVFLDDFRPLIVKPLAERHTPVHFTTETIGTSLLREIGAQTYGVVKGGEFEYLEMLPGDTAYDVMQNQPTVVLGVPHIRDKIYFLCGIAMAEAFIFSMGDRNSNIIINMDLVEPSSLEILMDYHARGGFVVANIDTATAFDRVIIESPERFLSDYFIANGPFLREGVLVDEKGVVVIKDPRISRKFIAGFTSRHKRLRSSLERGEINIDNINNLVEQNFGDSSPAIKGPILKRLSYSDDEIIRIFIEAIFNTAKYFLEKSQHLLVPYEI